MSDQNETFRPFVDCVRPADKPDTLICTPWTYTRDGLSGLDRDEGAPFTVTDVFDVDPANTKRISWKNYCATNALVAQLAGLAGDGSRYFLSNMTIHSHGLEFSSTRWRLMLRS